MIEFLNSVDTDVFLFLHSFHASALDPYMKALSGRFAWIPFYVALGAAVIWQYGWKRGFLLLVAISAAVGFSDAICAHLIRPAVERMRPSNPENPLSLLVHLVEDYRAGRFGFPSCHASNTFALATATSLVIRCRWYTIFIFLWALLQCYSRIYLGVHYPGDIIVGASIGTLMGWSIPMATCKLADIQRTSAGIVKVMVPMIACAAIMIALAVAVYA